MFGKNIGFNARGESYRIQERTLENYICQIEQTRSLCPGVTGRVYKKKNEKKNEVWWIRQ